jgi:hypothetical protein
VKKKAKPSGKLNDKTDSPPTKMAKGVKVKATKRVAK